MKDYYDQWMEVTVKGRVQVCCKYCPNITWKKVQSHYKAHYNNDTFSTQVHRGVNNQVNENWTQVHSQNVNALSAVASKMGACTYSIWVCL
jgi:hypothetical protein